MTMPRNKRILAAALSLLMLSDILFPTVVLALSTGPSQPEVQGFTPASATDMVNLFTGDVSYNIPLLELEGYPVNLAYSGGIGMEQEASWVGLGWSLSPGQVERNMRGIPDDFRGDEIVRTMNLRPNRTYGLNYDVGFQLFSAETSLIGGSLNLSASPSFNTYNLFAFELGVSMSMRSTKSNKPSFNAGLGFTSSSNAGLSMQPRLGFDSGVRENDKDNASAGLNFGLNISSRQGLTNMTLGASLNASRNTANQKDLKKVSWEEGPRETKHIMPRIRTARLQASSGVGSSFNFGAPAFSPQIGLPMTNRSLSFSFTWGPAVIGTHPNMTLGAFYSEQVLASNERRTPSYGFIHHEAGQLRDDAQLDYNREKDGPYSGDRPALGIANLTNDFFSVSGQAISGSYRAYRAEVGHVYDPTVASGGWGGSAGLDVGAGLLAHGGARVMVNTSNSSSGRWSMTTNQVGQRLRYRGLNDRPELERVYFREASEPTVEQDSALWGALMTDQPVRFSLPSMGAYANRLGATVTNGTDFSPIPTTNYRTKREPRGQLFTYLDHATATAFALVPPIDHGTYIPPGHHMSEVTVLDKQGGRHIYGIPAYNMKQVDVEFNVEGTGDANGYVGYGGTDNSTGNERGRDHFYSKTETPAYAYAFLLTAVLSHDYSDADDVQGPSDGDLGGYTKFAYVRTHDEFPWRTPATTASSVGRFVEGRPAVKDDNKCTFVYGTKEIYYLNEIETKNYVAVFHLDDEDPDNSDDPDFRQDARGVAQNGLRTGDRSSKLDSISLYEKASYRQALADNETLPSPIKRVHFRYDYSLCPGTPTSDAIGQGKLTLKKVFFTYGASRMGVTAPYVFNYSGVNPNYSPVKQDRWGTYKEEGDARNDDYPYAEQVPVTADANASAWQLNDIRLPSGGRITLHYEADDYGYVQDKRAMRMFELDNITNTATPIPSGPTADIGGYYSSPQYLWISPPPGFTPEDIDQMVAGVDDLYFRTLIELTDDIADVVPGYEGDYVSGYTKISEHGFHTGSGKYFIKLDRVEIDQGASTTVSPIYRAALEYVRVNYPEQTANNLVDGFSSNPSPTLSLFTSMAGSVFNFITGFAEFFNGPNKALSVAKPALAETVVLNKSWIKLNDPDFNKKGGGYRIQGVDFKDEWQVMETSEADRTYTYSQQYTYGDENGSWGIAAFEPLVGADELPHRRPVAYSVEHALSPDDRFYMEEPFGESMFPSPVVGYSKVVVTDDLSEEQRNVQGTGRVVHEFYTARDFPTIVQRTAIHPQRRQNNANLLALLGFKKIDHMHASQGFVVETNDMHGKPKSTAAYPEGSDNAVSYVEYHYDTRPYGSALRLKNVQTTIDPSGNISRETTIGRDYEFLADTRQFISKGISGGADVKFELLYAVIAGIPVPLYLPKLSSESTRFQTGVMVKKIHRFGRIREVVKMENGSRVSTENLAYDALTGQVLVTRTANNFKDPIYNISFPAYWHYDGMGLAYRNIGATITGDVDSQGRFSHSQAHELFVPGDELALVNTATQATIRAWVDERAGNTVTLVPRTLEDLPAGNYRMKVIRSGHRNIAGAPMMEMTTLLDPLEGLAGNIYQEIVNANAVEYGQDWATDCLCLANEVGSPPLNRWVLNQRGVWRVSKDNVWLTDRTRSVSNSNSNIRRDGFYMAFDPFYKVVNGTWEKDAGGWTTTRTVTHYSNSGQELENKDALGLHSAVNIGYKGTLVKSVARNAQYRETGFDGFEETTPVNCADQHFRLYGGPGSIMDGIAHSGRRSLRVVANEPVSFVRTATTCDPGGCHLGLDLHSGVLTISGAEGAVTLTATTVYGSVALMPSPTGGMISGTAPWAIIVQATDSDGCTVQQQFNSE